MSVYPMWQAYPSLAKELERTQKKMTESIQLQDEEVKASLLELVGAGGKMLRPAYLLLFSHYGKKRHMDKLISLASSIEMLHTASLIHDDIVDESAVRRGVPTIQSRFGTGTAIYAGDYLFVLCFLLLSNYSADLKSVQKDAISMEKVLMGELNQKRWRYNRDITKADYLTSIKGKTAELFGLSCFIGAFEGGSTKRFSYKCYDIGISIGMAFQIIDDILDYTTSEEQLGKTVLQDVRQGIYSLPLILALKQDSDESLEKILKQKSNITNQDITIISNLLKKYNSIEAARDIAKEYTKMALLGISQLPETNYGTKQILRDVTTKLLSRTT